MPSRLTILKSALFLLLLAVIPAYFWQQGYVSAAFLASLQDRAALGWLEQGLRESLPMSAGLEHAGRSIRLFGGQQEQNGIFIRDTALIRNIASPVPSHVAANTAAIVDFAQMLLGVSNRKEQTYLAVIPTAGAILDRQLPRFAASGMVNQRRVIEDIYNQVSPSVRTMDVYSTLDEHDGEYIYYRTEDNLSALGGYYIYYAMGRRLGLANRALNRYEVQYAADDFYGSLYRAPQSPSSLPGIAAGPRQRIEPDVLALYRYSYTPREYIVTHTNGGEKTVYHTLYPMHRMLLGDLADVYLGGSSPRIEIESSAELSSGNKTRLLVFGDKTAAAYLPFLANHYQQVTLCNLSFMTESEIQALRPDNYDEVIFAYSIESYIHTSDHIARIRGIDWDSLLAD